MALSKVCVLSLLLLSLPSVAQDDDHATMQAKFPNQYQSWASTVELKQRKDLLEENPALVILWAGAAYSKEYHSARGHAFAVADVSHTLRTGQAVPVGEQGLSASCWTCKSPDVPRLINQIGVENFSSKNFADLGTEMKNVIYCNDCHVKGSSELALPRPHAQKAMEKVNLPFDKQNSAMQDSQVCGQCHVTYYFRPERSNIVNIPWIFGNTADKIEQYYDTRRFYEWIHPISRTPLVKARHPEFEQWSRSTHAKLGVSCVSCHMGNSTDAEGNAFTNHKVISQALNNYDNVCQKCHKSKQALTSRLDHAKADIAAKARTVEQLLVKAHYEAGAAWDAGANWEMMNAAIMDIRHSQWRWDFAMSSHGLYAHNSKEAHALLDKANEQVTAARTKLAEILENLKVTKVNYPDYSTKTAAQKAIGINLEQLTKEKQKFIEQEIDKHWPAVSQVGYQN